MKIKKKKLHEADASFGVPAKIADPVGEPLTPAGDPLSGDAGGNPEPEGSNPPELSKVDAISAIVDALKGMSAEDLQDAFDAITTSGGEGKSADEKNAWMRANQNDVPTIAAKNESADEDEDENEDEKEDEKEDEDEDEKEKDEAFDFNFDKKDDEDDDKEKEDDEDDDKEKEDEKEDEDEDKDEKKEKNESFTVSRGDLNLSEDMAAIFSGSELTEEFKSKASEIFEAVVIEKVNTQLARLQEAVEADIRARATKKLQGIAERVDTYLGYVVEQWMTDNAIAVESGLQREITEEFIGGLHKLFNEHYISVPDQKEDIVEKLVAKNAELEAALNEEIRVNANQKQLTEGLQRKAVLSTITEGLTDLQTAKLVSIAESLSFNNTDEFASKVQGLRESYFSSQTQKTGPRTLEEGNVIELTEAEQAPTGAMGMYAARISRDVTA
jgi:hypothetical protein